MNVMKAKHVVYALIVAIVVWAAERSALAQTNSQVNFTLSLNNTVDAGLMYNGHQAGDTNEARFVIGFQIGINSIDGVTVNTSPVAAFCSEVAEPIGTSTYTFTAKPLAQLAEGRAGQAGTASAGIPIGGIGDLRAARLAYLFDNYYTSVALTGWTRQNLHAFQISVWEVTHDQDLNVFNTSGTNYFATQTGGSLTTFRQDSLNLAQTWLNNIAAANVAQTYVSSAFNIYALTSTSGNGAYGFQDVVLALPKAVQEFEEINGLIVIPEPPLWMASALVCLVALALRPAHRRRSKGGIARNA